MIKRRDTEVAVLQGKMNGNRIEVEREYMPENLHSCLLGVGLGLRKNGECLGNEVIMVLKAASIVHGILGCSMNVTQALGMSKRHARRCSCGFVVDLVDHGYE